MWVLGVDVGTSFTVAAVRHVAGPGADRPPEIVPLGGESKMASAVYRDPDGQLLVGPQIPIGVDTTGLLERTPKVHFGDGKIPLGDAVVEDVDLFVALLRFVAEAAQEMCNNHPADRVNLTHPASWHTGKQKRLILAAERAGLPTPHLIPEPIAAATALAYRGALTDLPDGAHIVVYDLGGGTLDLTLLQHHHGSFIPIGQPVGHDTLGGETLDKSLLDHILTRCTDDDREYLIYPDTADDPHAWTRAYHELRTNVRIAKERLKHTSTATIILPPPITTPATYTLTRDELHTLAQSLLTRTTQLLDQLLVRNGLSSADLATICLVGGGSQLTQIPRHLHTTYQCPITAHGDLTTLTAHGATYYNDTTDRSANQQPQALVPHSPIDKSSRSEIQNLNEPLASERTDRQQRRHRSPLADVVADPDTSRAVAHDMSKTSVSPRKDRILELVKKENWRSYGITVPVEKNIERMSPRLRSACKEAIAQLSNRCGEVESVYRSTQDIAYETKTDSDISHSEMVTVEVRERDGLLFIHCLSQNYQWEPGDWLGRNKKNLVSLINHLVSCGVLPLDYFS